MLLFIGCRHYQGGQCCITPNPHETFSALLSNQNFIDLTRCYSFFDIRDTKERQRLYIATVSQGLFRHKAISQDFFSAHKAIFHYRQRKFTLSFLIINYFRGNIRTCTESLFCPSTNLVFGRKREDSYFDRLNRSNQDSDYYAFDTC